MDASQRVALVTGAANGIGKSIALRLANDEFDVALNDLAQNAGLLQDLKEEIEMLGGKVLVIVADVTVEEEVKRMIDTAVKELGSLDVASVIVLTLRRRRTDCPSDGSKRRNYGV